MSRRNLFAVETRRQTIKRSKLQTTVTRDTRNRRLAIQVAGDERLYHIALKLALKIEHVEWKAQLFGHTPRVVHIIERATARRQRVAVLINADPAPLIPQLHREADKLMSFGLQNCCRRARIHAAAHGYCDLHINLLF